MWSGCGSYRVLLYDTTSAFTKRNRKKKNNEKRIYYTSRLSFNDTERSMGIIRWLFVTLNCVSQRFLASLAPYEDPVKVRIKNTTSDGNRTVELADSWHV